MYGIYKKWYQLAFLGKEKCTMQTYSWWFVPYMPKGQTRRLAQIIVFVKYH